MQDKDGKKLQIGSIVSAKKPGCTKHTLKGVLIEEDALGNIVFMDSQERRRTYRPADIKRVRYRVKS